MKTLCYASFECPPSREPPFALELGFSDQSRVSIAGCEHVADAIEKLVSCCAKEKLTRSGSFTLLYPIYLDAMDTDDETTMHEVAALIREQADKGGWNFSRIDGYTGKAREDFVFPGPAELFERLAPEQQRQVHLRLCVEALGAWLAYSAEHAPIRYMDTVVGGSHEVDVLIPGDALRSADAGADLANVDGRYYEPIVAMQDDDLEFPDPIEFAYYAVYNCFRRHARGEAIDSWLIVNQALSSIDDASTWAPRLTAAMTAAGESA